MLVEDLAIASTNGDQTGNHDEDEPPIKIVSPAQNSIFRIARNLPRENQKIHIQILSRSQSASITLYLDGVSIANFSQAPYEIWVPLTPGTHHIRAESDLSGEGHIASDTVTYNVQEE